MNLGTQTETAGGMSSNTLLSQYFAFVNVKFTFPNKTQSFVSRLKHNSLVVFLCFNSITGVWLVRLQFWHLKVLQPKVLRTFGLFFCKYTSSEHPADVCPILGPIPLAFLSGLQTLNIMVVMITQLT